MFPAIDTNSRKPAGKLAVLLMLLSLVGTATAQDGTIVRNSKLFKTPSYSANPIAELAIGSEVSSSLRRGGWKKIKVKKTGQSGWIRGYTMRAGVSSAQVRQVTTKKSGSVSGGLSSLTRGISSLFGGADNSNQNQGNLTTTVGIRGLSAKDIESAVPDRAATKQMIAYQISPARARKFAGAVKLNRNKMKHLKATESSSGKKSTGLNNDK